MSDLASSPPLRSTTAAMEAGLSTVSSPVSVALYPLLAIVLLTAGLGATGSFALYEVRAGSDEARGRPSTRSARSA
jgi:hypothetical protein